jgi:hypothetical protein
MVAPWWCKDRVWGCRPYPGSLTIIWRRCEWVRRLGRDGEDRGARPRLVTPFVDGDEGVARILVRVGACADELRLMGVMREEVLASWGNTGEGWGSDARNTSSVSVPSFIERMCNDP